MNESHRDDDNRKYAPKSRYYITLYIWNLRTENQSRRIEDGIVVISVLTRRGEKNSGGPEMSCLDLRGGLMGLYMCKNLSSSTLKICALNCM